MSTPRFTVRLREKNGRFYAVVRDPSRKPARKTITLKTDNRKLAEDRRLRIELDYEFGRVDPWDGDRESISWDEAIDLFLASREDPRPRTIDTYRQVLRQFHRTFPVDVALRGIDESDVRRFTEDASVSKSTRRKRFVHLKAFFRWAAAKRLVDVNPLEGLKAPKERRKVPRYLTAEQVSGLLRAIDSDVILKAKHIREGEIVWLKDVIRFGVGTGLRRSEICHLKWSAINLTPGEERVIVQTDRAFDTKSGHERSVDLVADALDVVRELEGRRSSEGEGYVFTMPSGSQLDPNHVTRRFRFYCEKTGLPPRISFHCLRHTFATRLLLKGVPMKIVSEILGHSSIAVTEIYAHAIPSVTRSEMHRALTTQTRRRGPGEKRSIIRSRRRKRPA